MPHPETLYRTRLMRTLHPYLWRGTALSTSDLDHPLVRHLVTVTDERDFQADLAEFSVRCHLLTVEQITYLFNVWYAVTGCLWRYPAISYRTRLMQELFYWLWRDDLVDIGEQEKEVVKKMIEGAFEELFKKGLNDFTEKYGKIKKDKMEMLFNLWLEARGKPLKVELSLEEAFGGKQM